MFYKYGIALAITAGTLAALALTRGETAFAEPNSNASCVGHGAAALSPPGSWDQFPGGMPEFNKLIHSMGVPPGVVYSTIAELHEGSDEACDAAMQ